jgi:hypothetical protein
MIISDSTFDALTAVFKRVETFYDERIFTDTIICQSWNEFVYYQVQVVEVHVNDEIKFSLLGEIGFRRTRNPNDPVENEIIFGGNIGKTVIGRIISDDVVDEKDIFLVLKDLIEESQKLINDYLMKINHLQEMKSQLEFKTIKKHSLLLKDA